MGGERNAGDEIATKVRPPATGSTSASTSTPAPAFELVILEGPEAGARFPLDRTGPTRLLIGQSAACGVRLSDPQVSRRHAALHHAGQPEVQLTDLGSKNGTFLNGVRIADVFLRGGEVVRMGDSAMRLELVEAAEVMPIPTASRFGRIVGASVEMRRLYPLLQRLAASHVPVVIEGETGTGKELLAESLHSEGPRADKPFMVFDCTTLAPSLVELELFGQESDASTGAAPSRKGLFELAHGGTLFIDEIGDLDLSLQPKLLRAIERSEVRRVGGDRWLPVDVRIIAATRRDLDAEVQAGRFRDDLFLRLAITRIELPPLRARIGDVPVLAQHFWRELGGGARVLPYDVLQRCEAYHWPGNVRELYNEIARRLALGDLEDAARARPSPDAVLAAEAEASRDFIESVLALDLPLPHSRARLLDEFHRRYVERVVTQHGGNIRRAAAASGIAHRYFQILRARNTK